MNRYVYSIAIGDVEANSEAEADKMIQQMLTDGIFDIELVEVLDENGDLVG